ncbi:MAG: hypothetical protein FWE84_05940 [Firmicutes bacterium]|nr:hypothetical protein [Bacillota bacterium]
MFKKIVCLCAALVLVFSAFSFTACGDMLGLQWQIDELKKQVAQQADRIAELEQENERLAGEVAELLTEYKNLVKAQLEVYAAVKGEDNYSEQNWAIIMELVADGKTAIDAAMNKSEVDSALEAVKQWIDKIPQNIEGFELTISAEETILSQGQDFKVNVELKNMSGRDHEIVSQWLFLPNIPDWSIFGGDEIDSPEFIRRIIENNGAITNIGLWGNKVNHWILGHDLETGTHTLRFVARFYLNWQQKDQKLVEVWSNAIELTVQQTDEMTGFELTISVQKTTLPQGENFVVNAELKNQSGVDMRISYGSAILYPSIMGWNFPYHWYFPPYEGLEFLTIKNDEYFRDVWHLGGNYVGNWVPEGAASWFLPKGTHELRFFASFVWHFGDESQCFFVWPHSCGCTNQQGFTVWSNTVIITVI